MLTVPFWGKKVIVATLRILNQSSAHAKANVQGRKERGHVFVNPIHNNNKCHMSCSCNKTKCKNQDSAVELYAQSAPVVAEGGNTEQVNVNASLVDDSESADNDDSGESNYNDEDNGIELDELPAPVADGHTRFEQEMQQALDQINVSPYNPLGTSPNNNMTAFRTAYAQLNELRTLAPVNIVALTATATEATENTEGPLHLCCDNCGDKCECGSDECKAFTRYPKKGANLQASDIDKAKRNVGDQERQQLHKLLVKYHKTLGSQNGKYNKS
ncbi:hypothetical protein QZH41_005786 [Actinostola sp. cb2023]|nr:hypothetical protein QZH41_005786 [Actinostola sp. cb2023]